MIHSNIYGLGASVLFWIPGYYHFMTWIGVQPASKKNFYRLLKKGWVAVIVGGIAEMFMMRDDKEQIYLRERKGMVRMAVETGHDIVPIYHFGNTQVLSFGPAWLKHLSRRLRASVGMMYGRFGLPIPRPAEIMMACGPPVVAGPGMPKDHPDFLRTVDEVHQQLVDAMQKLYDDHRGMYGWADRPLIID
jgi:2-acylglycerol O-acyltransferase 2